MRINIYADEAQRLLCGVVPFKPAWAGQAKKEKRKNEWKISKLKK
jgi:hypothetical protein